MYERECLGNISFLTEQATQFNRVLLDVSNPRPRYSGKKPERGGGKERVQQQEMILHPYNPIRVLLNTKIPPLPLAPPHPNEDLGAIHRPINTIRPVGLFPRPQIQSTFPSPPFCLIHLLLGNQKGELPRSQSKSVHTSFN
jgi:hypothetical protein